jgi:glycosyltransferase involved in cell wall biosynthesis
MRVLVVHNEYQQRGGEEVVVEAESKLLMNHGHDVFFYRRNNDELRHQNLFEALGTGMRTIWAPKSYRELEQILVRAKPDVVHFHNTFPLISPAAYYACSRTRVPVVQTLHNYRLVCPAAMFLRNGLVCEKCLGRSVPWPGVAHACYRNSRAATSSVVAMVAAHRALGTWQRRINTYVALTEFARRKFIESGLPPERILVKPNFVSPDPGVGASTGDYALFVGRLAQEKGLDTLLRCWGRLGTSIPLKIAGEGPLREELEALAKRSNLRNVFFLGRLASAEVLQSMRGARFLVFPSRWFEGFPLTIAEAYACGIPVIAPRLGAIAEIVLERETGLQFEPENEADLSAKIEWAWSHLEEMRRMGRNARLEYEAKYTAEQNYRALMTVYEHAQTRNENASITDDRLRMSDASKN